MKLGTFSVLRERAKEIMENLNWQNYHTQENLVLFLLGESAELGEYCQWLSKKDINCRKELKNAVSEEIADVIKNVLYLANSIQLVSNLEELIIRKLELDRYKYPVKKFKGKSRYQVVKRIKRQKRKPPLIPGKKLQNIPLITDLQKRAWKFAKDRKWQRFYSPKSLALAIAVKSGEIAICYQRRPSTIQFSHERTIWALADILISALRLYEFLGVHDIFQIVLKKLNSDEKRFRKQQKH